MKIRMVDIVFFTVISVIVGIVVFRNDAQDAHVDVVPMDESGDESGMGGEIIVDTHPLAIEYMRQQDYPGSDIVIEQILSPGANYDRYIVSYISEGLTQFALLTVPRGTSPDGGWPAIVFNHGYISPDIYRTTERYIAYTDALSRNGYVVLKPDYRGHGNSEGEAKGGYGSPAYTIDVLNGLSSLKKYPGVNPDNIGMWGHSMGGAITLRSMVIVPDVKAGVIWAGVVGSYEDLFTRWRRSGQYANRPSPRPNSWRSQFVEQYGEPSEGNVFWDEISATSYLSDISGPVQLHHATGDQSVPYEFSQTLHDRMQKAEKLSELYIYQGDDHNINQNFSTAMGRTVAFFDMYLK